ncbi:vitamin K epoxide reductase family protein [Pedomonas mirosovicensis]|uniref:vitamin K epoxide reductase family protein n=1 Tax=Pedomonas mirosovicensis TaxID=2908641 RepID=UPI00216753B0|nr:vitamin K epoxide reductase family protein [Pedomonas mirosovicensis]MCH8686766.1 NAD-dependent epimerase/dehydratase family protein [Pedomonas mirosovicensis]
MESARPSTETSAPGQSAAGKPVVLITGATGNLGRSLAGALSDAYRIVGLDLKVRDVGFPVLEADFSSDDSLREALAQVQKTFGSRIASVIHLVAFFDFTGEENPLYQSVNVEGTRCLLRSLQNFEVEQFVYSSTMLVHAPCRPGEQIDETQPIDPRWAYPKSKAAAEAVIKAEHGKIPYVLLRLAGVYDEHTTVPTMAQQMARIYERDLESYFYSGSTLVGQSMLHREDMLDAFRRTVDRRAQLPPEAEILIGEADAIGYDALQDELGYLIHGEKEWPTLRLPKPIAAAGAWAQDKLEPVIPDMIDQGEKPFIKPFMVRMADDHYALDITRARQWLGWEPKHRLKAELPKMVAALKRDPIGWYKANGVTPPESLEAAADAAAETAGHPHDLTQRRQAQVAQEHSAYRWAHFANIGMGFWLLAQPWVITVPERGLAWVEVALGAALMVFASLAVSWRAQWARWVCAAIGAVAMAVPFLFWTTSGADYLSDTLAGMLIFGFAVCTRPEPGPSAAAALTGPDVPPGWDYNPSSWSQRLPIIALAVVGLMISRHLAAYQLGHSPAAWDPVFTGNPLDPKNGTEEIITSWVSEAWPVSDAAVGAYTYALEILTGIVGSRQRWRTMPWLVLIFGLMIAPLGVTSIFFIIIQPILLGTWSLPALIAAAVMLIQIPYSLDELLATIQFLRRRIKAGRNWLYVLLFGDTDEGEAARPQEDEFARAPGAVLREMVAGGVSLPWPLAASALIGLWLLFTRVTLGNSGSMANADHLIGSLALTVVSIASAEVARPVRFLNVLLGAALCVTPFLYDASTTSMIASILCGLALAALSIPKGPIRNHYGRWDRLIV